MHSSLRNFAYRGPYLIASSIGIFTFTFPKVYRISLSCSSFLDCLNLLGKGEGVAKDLPKEEGVLTLQDGLRGGGEVEVSSLVEEGAPLTGLTTSGNNEFLSVAEVVLLHPQPGRREWP